ncbi:n-acetylglucosaminyl-phosphatidylinositol de-n-acetylase [Trichoderma arundinaceum]|uniref:N-acetylglucosaminylphosphatidylinositol deacetylase n=1 Tax=Trichoderma arundinaceum TaxID=490622 RepID=A0A395NZW0_TRIAR|nr:n-acetylglucosaminyl-phosphatidylinositol de-n-acetylase [Trichoderma arundinaceum]
MPSNINLPFGLPFELPFKLPVDLPVDSKSLLVLAASVVAAVPCIYICTASAVRNRFPELLEKRVCLLIAHPDDEAMFFAPTVLALARPETGNHVKILCLSAGNAEGLGETRKKELIKSGLALGLRDESDVFVVDNPKDFPDSMTAHWDETKIANLLTRAFAPQLAQQRAENAPEPTANIDALITFDGSGVSSHPNHISLYHGARGFAKALTEGKPEWKSPVDVYTLGTVNLLRKYSGGLDLFTTIASSLFTRNKDPEHPERLIYANNLVGSEPKLGTAWGAMTTAHKSQMVWFRYLWLGFSRYMLVNDLRLEKVDQVN